MGRRTKSHPTQIGICATSVGARSPVRCSRAPGGGVHDRCARIRWGVRTGERPTVPRRRDARIPPRTRARGGKPGHRVVTGASRKLARTDAFTQPVTARAAVQPQAGIRGDPRWSKR